MPLFQTPSPCATLQRALFALNTLALAALLAACGPGAPPARVRAVAHHRRLKWAW